MADAFLGGAKAATVHECVRSCGMKVRYDSADEAFGVIDSTDIIRTYYKPVPCSSLPGAARAVAKQAGRCHACANNLVYFKGGVQKMKIENHCPVCGYEMEVPPKDYNTCPSCGTEFGVADTNASIAELRETWLKTGPRWWSKTDPQATDWDPIAQMEKAGIVVRRQPSNVSSSVSTSSSNAVVTASGWESGQLGGIRPEVVSR